MPVTLQALSKKTLRGELSGFLSITDMITEQKSHILYGLVALGLLSLALLIALFVIKRQNTKLHRHRLELQDKNQELNKQWEAVREKNALLEEQQHQLHQLNEQLMDTNFKREGFYSPQTIYNYRSAVKNRAINKDSFETDIAKICWVIRWLQKNSAGKSSIMKSIESQVTLDNLF